MTLVELLVALAVAVLVSAALVLVHNTTRAVVRGQREREGRDDARQALDELARRLACGFTPPEEEDSPFLIVPGAEASFSFFAIHAPPGERVRGWYDAGRYHVRLVDPGPDGRLLLVYTALRGGEESQTNELARGIAAFDVQAFDGTAWHDAWPPGDPWPRAARLCVTPAEAEHNGGRICVEVFLPAGQTIPEPGVRER